MRPLRFAHVRPERRRSSHRRTHCPPPNGAADRALASSSPRPVVGACSSLADTPVPGISAGVARAQRWERRIAQRPRARAEHRRGRRRTVSRSLPPAPLWQCLPRFGSGHRHRPDVALGGRRWRVGRVAQYAASLPRHLRLGARQPAGCQRLPVLMSPVADRAMRRRRPTCVA